MVGGSVDGVDFAEDPLSLEGNNILFELYSDAVKTFDVLGMSETKTILTYLDQWSTFQKSQKSLGLLQTKLDKTLAANPKNKVFRILFIFMDMFQDGLS